VCSLFIKEDEVAEEKAAAAAPEVASSGGAGQKPVLWMALAVVNMLVVGLVGFMLYKGRQKDAAEPKLEHVVQGVAHDDAKDAEVEAKEFVGKVVPLETFIVNLAGSKGRKVAKVNMELELKGEGVGEEIEKRKAQIRDYIIIILSSKTYEEISTKDGKNNLRNEIKDTINSYLTKGKITNVFFTEFIYN
jgi:flagellar FliL protein